MTARFRFARHGRDRLREVERVLHAAYGAPESLLGNQIDPLDEAIYIILSFQTDLRRFKETWQNLRSAFPRWEDVEAAPLKEVSAALRSGGLHRQKARAIKLLLRAVRRRFRTLSLRSLHDMSDRDAERVLTRLPGISWKGARCVLLYSLDREVLPIDGNSFRVLQRTGVIPLSAVYRRLSLHDAIQAAIEPRLRRRFHVNLVVHGQDLCLPERPRCRACPAAQVCLKRGLRQDRTRENDASWATGLAFAQAPTGRRAPQGGSGRRVQQKTGAQHEAAAG
jgi:endonuclease III